MDRIDPRIVRVSVEISGTLRVFEGLDIVAKGKKTANPLQNACEVILTNLNTDDRNYLLTETSPFNRNRKPKRVIVEAGRESFGTTRVFVGDITSATPTQPPDIGLCLKTQTLAHHKGKILSRSGGARQSLRTLSGHVAGDLGVSLNFQAPDKSIANYAFSGAALGQVESLCACGDVDVFVDDETLVVKPKGAPLAGRVRQLSLDSGMIGIPEITEYGVKVKFLLDATTVVGGALDIVSKLNPALNGRYVIYALEFEVTSRQEPFYWIADARRPTFDTHGKLVIPKKETVHG
jgi:hypothetical protein